MESVFNLPSVRDQFFHCLLGFRRGRWSPGLHGLIGQSATALPYGIYLGHPRLLLYKMDAPPQLPTYLR